MIRKKKCICDSIHNVKSGTDVHSGSNYLPDKPLLFPLIGRNLYLIHMRYVLTDVRFIHIIPFYLEFVGRRRNVWSLGGGLLCTFCFHLM